MRTVPLTAHGVSYAMFERPGKIIRCMRNGHPYERHLLEHVYDLGLTGLVVDVGANIGNHTLWFARMCNLDVVAFEPLMPNALIANVMLNGLSDSVRVEPYALGDHDHKRLEHVGKGRFRPTDDDTDTFPVRALDSYDLDGVRMIKIDVEGMEPFVLRGGEHTIRRDRPIIFAEEWANDPSWHDAIAEVLEPWGYEMTQQFSGRESSTPVGKWEHG